METIKEKLSERLRPKYDAINRGVSGEIKTCLTYMGYDSSVERLNITIDELWRAVDEIGTGDTKDDPIDITSSIAWLQSIKVEMIEKINAGLR